MSRTVVVLAVLVLAVAGAVAGLFVILNRAEGPAIELVRPTDLVGRSAVFEATVEAPRSELTALEAVIEQDGAAYPLFSFGDPAAADMRQEGPDRIRINRTFDRESHPEIRAGTATVRVSATRPVVFGLSERSTTVAVDVEVRLQPPRLAVASTFHYVNHGGSEAVVYTVSPSDSESGVRVGDRLYPGYPAAGLVEAAGDNLRLAFFALDYDQDLNTPIELYATDAAGNEASAQFDHRRFPRNFRRARINVSDGFLRRVVPSIVSQAPELADEQPDGTDEDLLDLYLFINGELRRQNRATLIELAAGTAPQVLWDGAFRQLANSQVESGFADHRTYLYEGDEVDQQVHLGFDLASTANAPIRASNDGVVVRADYFGIYGNCVIVDHGMGLQSLYAHLSSIAVSPGDGVEQGQQLGLSGQTGLAGGDHLHFAMLLNGRPVSPVEWWDPHWIEDRILRKLRAASGAGD
ncbi:MAG: M23 family metallopeptidase [Acidobacteria bacterium]|nr:M23 family metallopeptidase [Acidobacteriota bacterium]